MEKITRARWLNFVLVIGLIAASLLVNAQYNPLTRRLRADPSIMLYVGQQMLRGNPPYVTVTIVKTPLAGMLTAGALGVGRAIAVDDVIAARAGFMLLASILIAVTFLFGAALWSRWSGLFAACALLGMDVLHQRVADGPSPKVPFILFGMAALWLGARRSWFLAGFAAMLSFLAWQPGLVFVAAAALGAFLNARETRWRAVGVSLAGALVPLLLVGAYLGASGALDAGLKQTLGANASYFGANKVGAGVTNIVRENLGELAGESPRCFANEELFVPLGIAGLFGIAAHAVWQARRGNRAPAIQTVSFFFTLVVLAGFTLIDFQSCADLLPFFPYLALGVGWLAWQALRAISLRLGNSARVWLPYALGGFLAVGILLYGLSDAFGDRRSAGLAQQRAMAEHLAQQLGPDARVQQFGDAVLLVLLRRQNATRFIHLGDKQGAGILRAEGIDPAELPRLLEHNPPLLITLSRAKDQPWAKPLYAWIETNYTLLESYDAANGGTPQQTDVYRLNTK